MLILTGFLIYNGGVEACMKHFMIFLFSCNFQAFKNFLCGNYQKRECRVMFFFVRMKVFHLFYSSSDLKACYLISSLKHPSIPTTFFEYVIGKNLLHRFSC